MISLLVSFVLIYLHVFGIYSVPHPDAGFLAVVAEFLLYLCAAGIWFGIKELKK